MGNILGINTGSVLVVVGLVGGLLVAFRFLLWESQRKSRRPFSGHPLRPPGESLRLQVDELGDRLYTRLLLLSAVLVPTIFLADGAFNRGDGTFAIALLATGAALMLVIVLWAWQTGKKLVDYSLGFVGERTVGEELNRLMLDGCQVFHDLTLERLGNVDHVVVAPHAVFAVETKAKSKRRPSDKDRETHKVTFTGQELVYPQGTDRKALEQARRNANALAEKLSRLTAEPVAVKPVLVLPGWWVDRTGKGDVAVLNDKPSQLRSAMVDAKSKPLDPKHRKRIVELLEEWSRQSMKR